MRTTTSVGWLVLDILQLLVDLKEPGNLRKLASMLCYIRWFDLLGVDFFLRSMNYGLGKKTFCANVINHAYIYLHFFFSPVSQT